MLAFDVLRGPERCGAIADALSAVGVVGHRGGDDFSDLFRRFASVERVSEPGRLVRVKEP